MGNQGSFMEKIYVYLPALICHSSMDYSDPATMRNIRLVYFGEQIVLFAFTAYFIFAIRRRHDERKILVPDISQSQVMTNNVPGPDELTYRRTTYFKHEMTEVFQQLQQQFVALMLTVLAHFILGFRPILLLQIFPTPYHFAENRFLRKFVLGLNPGYRVWGERFEGELEGAKVKEDGEEALAAQAAPAGDGVAGGGGDGADGAAALAGSGSSSVGDAPADVGATEAVDQPTSAPAPSPAPAPVVVAATAKVDEDNGEESLPMPRDLEDKLIDAWEAEGEGDCWGAVMEQLGPFSVNTQTPAGRWTPLMVACGLPQVGAEDIKALIEDLDARVDLRDQDGWTCLHWAAQHGRPDAARAVFEALASIASEPAAAAAAVDEIRATRDGQGKTADAVARAAGLESSVLEAFIKVLESSGSS